MDSPLRLVALEQSRAVQGWRSTSANVDEDRSLAQLLALVLLLLQSSNVEDDGGPSKCRQRPCASVTQERGQCPQESAAHTPYVVVCARLCICMCAWLCHKIAQCVYCVCVILFLLIISFSIKCYFFAQVLHKSASSALKSHWHAHTVCGLLRTRRSSLLPMTALF